MFIKNSILLILLSIVISLSSFAQLPVKDTLHLKHILVFPVIARSIETDWSFGVAGSATVRLFKKDTMARTSNIQALALYSLKKQFVAAINGAIYFRKEKYVLNEQLSYSSFPDKFWGLGQNTNDSSEEDYSFKQYYIYLHLMRKVAPDWFIGGLFEFQNLMDVDYVKGGLYDTENIPGKNGYHVSGLGLSLTYDNRNDAFSPDKGSFIQFHFTHFNNVFGSSFNYTNWVIDARKYFKAYKNQVLAVQALWVGNEGNNVPIRSLASLGGSTNMRGYYEGRYRDKGKDVLQAEYRIPVYNRWGAVAFGSMGNVSSSIKDVTINCKYAWGAGLRFALNKNEKLNLRLDYGISSEHTSGLYFQLGEAF